jgi:VRR-NUC domain
VEDIEQRGAARKRADSATEAQIQKALFAHLRARGAPGIFFWHPFSGGYRRPKEAAIYKGLGAIPGLPDAMILHQGKLYCVELKAEGGRLSENQERVLIKLREAGAMATHAHGLDQALRVLEGWGLLRGSAS